MNPVSLLGQFNNNEPQRDAVKAFMIETLRELAADKALNGEDTKGISEANQTIEAMFNKLAAIYGKISRPVDSSPR